MNLPSEAASSVTEWLGPDWTARSLAGDASVRAYFRVTTKSGETFIVTYYPEDVRRQLRHFMEAYDTVASCCAVPEVLRHSESAVLQRDVGERTLFAALHQNREEGLRLYRAAIDLLAAFQKAPDRELNPPFSAAFFMNELEMAREFYVEKLMDFDGERLRPVMKMICENVTRHPYTLCHRDFHGQNIHVLNDTLFLIDYQDLRGGPDTYDMASLLRDRGVARILGKQAEMDLLAYYAERTGASGDVRRRYFEALLQRSIKILGTYSKMPIVRGLLHYLDFIPPTLESIRRCLDELPEHGALRDIFPFDFDLERARARARSLHGST